MKKLLAVLLAVAMVLSFASCGGEKTKSNGDVTVVWYVPGDKQADVDLINEAASKITMEKLGVKLEFQFIDLGAFTQRMNMNFASQSDAFDLTFTGYINPYKDGASKGAYLALDEYIENSEILQEVVPEYARKAATYNGKIYGIPNMQIMANLTTGLFVQEDLAEEYGLKVDEIKSLQDIEPFLKWVKENHPELYGFRTGGVGWGVKGDPVATDTFSGIRVDVNEDGSLSYKTELDYKEPMIEHKLMRSWFEKGYIRADVASVNDDTTEHLAGKYAVWRGIYKPGAAAEFNSNNPTNRCVVAQITDAYMPYNAGFTAMTAINANTKHPDEAFKVLELVNSDAELFNILSFGIEGKHYNLDENGKVVLVDNSGYKPGGAWKFGNVFNSLLFPGQDDDLWEQTKAFNDSARRSPLMGFSFDTTPVRTEIGQIATVSSKYQQGVTGAEPIENWRPAFLAELKTAGVEKIAAELEKQVTEWMNANK